MCICFEQVVRLEHKVKSIVDIYICTYTDVYICIVFLLKQTYAVNILTWALSSQYRADIYMLGSHGTCINILGHPQS